MDIALCWAAFLNGCTASVSQLLARIGNRCKCQWVAGRGGFLTMPAQCISEFRLSEGSIEISGMPCGQR